MCGMQAGWQEGEGRVRAFRPLGLVLLAATRGGSGMDLHLKMKFQATARPAPSSLAPRGLSRGRLAPASPSQAPEACPSCPGSLPTGKPALVRGPLGQPGLEACAPTSEQLQAPRHPPALQVLIMYRAAGTWSGWPARVAADKTIRNTCTPQHLVLHTTGLAASLGHSD